MLSLARLRADAREIFAAGVKSADPFAAVLKTLEVEHDCLRVADRTYDLAGIQNIFVAGGGKASAPMARAAEKVLAGRISGGVIVVKYGHRLQLDKINLVEAGHPVPDQAGLDGARQIIELARRCGDRDLFLFLISGGGSALLPAPADGLTLDDKKRTTEALLRCGATIQEVNAVRKHISRIKGGRLAQLAAPARLIALILSDVVHDPLEAIASGPTVPDNSTYGDCLEIFRRYDLRRQVPIAVVDFLERGAEGLVAETPKRSEQIFQNIQNVIVGGNAHALAAAQDSAEALGYHTRIVTNTMAGESRDVAKAHSTLIKETVRRNELASRPACFLSGGETTVTVRGGGMGGRNQEFCLAAAVEIEGMDGVVILSGGTDGTDGPTDAAGGIVDGSTIDRGRAKNFNAAEYLARNDSHNFLRATGDLLVTGPTLTNVMDLQITLIA
jgi:hydroxypyruvate reductase